MKTILLYMIFVTFSISGLSAMEPASKLSGLLLATAINSSGHKEDNNQLDWQVGDYVIHELSTLIFFKSTITEEVIEEIETGFWTKTTNHLPDGEIKISQNLYRRADGKLIKRIVNGEEQPIGDDPTRFEVILEEDREVTVKAGTFMAHYQLLNVYDQNNPQETIKVEVWVNKQETALNGTLKLTMADGFLAYNEMIEYHRQ